MPLAADAFDDACAPVSSLRLRQLLPTGRSAVLIGSGGRDFFERFVAETSGGDGAPNPLDRFTRRTVTEVVGAVMASAPSGVAYRVLFPFVGESPGTPVIPFQRLGRAAGLGGPGPLALQIHPEFGPWWAYRALLLLDQELPPTDPVGDGCAGCDAPCVAACPAHAVQTTGFVLDACHDRRLAAAACRESCAARIRCVRGPQHRYSESQLAFFMRASMPLTAVRRTVSTARPMPSVNAHITGTVWKIEVKVGDTVAEGQTVVILESMKMEMPVESTSAGTVTAVLVKEGDAVAEGAPVIQLG